VVNKTTTGFSFPTGLKAEQCVIKVEKDSNASIISLRFSPLTLAPGDSFLIYDANNQANDSLVANFTSSAPSQYPPAFVVVVVLTMMTTTTMTMMMMMMMMMVIIIIPCLQHHP
jgi:hypothetical protein